MNENCSNQSQSSNRSHTRHILFVALNFSYRTSLSWTVFAFSSCFWLNSINSNSLPFNCTFNHNHYNLLKCDWCISCFIFHLSLCIVVIGKYSRTVGCNRTPVIGQITTNHTKFAQLNPPITELITITIATTTYPEKKKKKRKEKKKNWEISRFFASDIVPTRDVCLKCIFFFGNYNGYDLLTPLGRPSSETLRPLSRKLSNAF